MSETLSPAARALADVPAEPGVPKPDAILVADHVRKHFGGVKAVDVEHLEIQRGAITALIGPNGAGKTTLFNCLTGFDHPDSGSWTFEGESIARTPGYRVARKGMVRTFQLTKALRRMTVMENMKLAAPKQRGEHFLPSMVKALWRRQDREIEHRADELLEWFELSQMRDEYAGALSGGQKKLLEMARALMAEPTLIMLDEPLAGVNPALTQRLLQHVEALRDERGITVLFIEHDMDVVMGISDWVVCLAEGAVISEGPPSTVGSDPAVIEAYLGTAAVGSHDRDRTDQSGTEATGWVREEDA
jgi:branched-chain amino acid transport system ATP-binding protein